MDFDTYQDLATKTSQFPKASVDGLIYNTLGVANEAGEFAGKVKKFLRGDVPKLRPALELTMGGCKLNEEHTDLVETYKNTVTAELGDVLWYISQVARMVGVSMNDVAAYNIGKLAKRAQEGKIKGDGDNR